jgi:hypothetical protein
MYKQSQYLPKISTKSIFETLAIQIWQIMKKYWNNENFMRLPITQYLNSIGLSFNNIRLHLYWYFWCIYIPLILVHGYSRFVVLGLDWFSSCAVSN